MPDSEVTSISGLKGVEGATGALVLNSIHVSGSFGNFFGGGSSSSPSATATPTPTPTATATPTASATASPSPGAFGITSFSVDGIDPAYPGVGLLSGANITAGSAAVQQWFDEAQQGTDGGEIALVSSSYASQNSIKAGSTVTIAGTSFEVVGLVTVSETDGADVYIPLSQAQSLSDDAGDVNTIYVTATDSSAISTVQSEIQKLIPAATVTTASDLASNVSGSLSTASTLANTLGTWLSALVLLAAFVLAVLLTIASVTRTGARVRDPQGDRLAQPAHRRPGHGRGGRAGCHRRGARDRPRGAGGLPGHPPGAAAERNVVGRPAWAGRPPPPPEASVAEASAGAEASSGAGLPAPSPAPTPASPAPSPTAPTVCRCT